MVRSPNRFLGLFLAIFAFALPSCGGGGGGSEGAGQGLVLLSLSAAGVDNAFLNERLEFRFSEAVDPATIGGASIQVREGPSFGASVPGVFITQGATVIFEPQLASLCDQSDSGFKPSTRYRVQLMGFPEEFAVRNSSGQALSSTQTYEFFTRADTDPDKYADQIPGVGPNVVAASPAHGDQAVPVVGGNRIELTISENLNPCTVNADTVLIHVYELGDPAVNAVAPNGKTSGFSSDGTNGGSTADQAPADPTTWGSVGTTSYASDPLRILCDIHVEQDFNGTRIVAIPLLGAANGAPRFPENAMVVVQLTFGIEDFGNQAMTPTTISFTTENLAPSNSAYTIENEGETEYDTAATTAAVNPDPRAPSRVQAYMLFAGDGDNGIDQLSPSLPETPASGCTLPRQPNDGTADDFQPVADVTLDTGATFNTCPNGTDGSEAVVWEFNTFRIGAGITVRVVGVNPAILLVQGDVLIESGGRLLVRGDGAGGSPRSAGASGTSYTSAKASAGGIGVAGAGNGGTAIDPGQNAKYGNDGFAGLGSPDYDPTMTDNGIGEAGEGTGLAGQPTGATSSSSPWDGSSAGGGGAGHATVGQDGQANDNGNNFKLQLAPRGDGGTTYERAGNSNDKLQMPEAGSGGGAAGFTNSRPFSTSSSYEASGGAGGAGGGFLDITSSGDINILGTLDAAGSPGGAGAGWNNYYASAGGGGGSGGGLRLLTPNKILLAPTTVVTAAGGKGGTGANPNIGASARNDGGDGGNGRIVMETGDSIVTNLAAANVTPADGSVGFFRGTFDAARFQGGGLQPKAVTLPITIGNYAGFNPTFVEPVAADFICGVPVAASPGIGQTAIVVEVRGSQMLPDGTLDAGSTTDYVTLGYFTDSGIENDPNWNFAKPPAAAWVPPADNGGGDGFAALNALAGGDGFEFLEVRFTFLLPATVGPFDPGAFIDDWTIRFSHDN